MEKLAEVTTWRESTLFSEAERLALEYAERITYTDRKVDDALVDQLKKHYRRRPDRRTDRRDRDGELPLEV